MWNFGEGMGWMMAFGSVWMIFFWGAIIALVVWGVKRLTDRGSSRPDRPGERHPLDIAKERYAKGEISREEFEQIKKDVS